jgi:hypothetical protein
MVGFPFIIGLDIAQIAYVARFTVGACVVSTVGIEVTAGGFAVGSRLVTELVDVKAVLLAWVQPGDVGFDYDALFGRCEFDNAFHGAPIGGDKHSDCSVHGCRGLVMGSGG